MTDEKLLELEMKIKEERLAIIKESETRMDKRIEKSHIAVAKTVSNLGADVKETRDDIKKIKENHLFHIEKDVACLTTKMEVLMKVFWLQLGAVISGIAGIIFALTKLL